MTNLINILNSRWISVIIMFFIIARAVVVLTSFEYATAALTHTSQIAIEWLAVPYIINTIFLPLLLALVCSEFPGSRLSNPIFLTTVFLHLISTLYASGRSIKESILICNPIICTEADFFGYYIPELEVFLRAAFVFLLAMPITYISWLWFKNSWSIFAMSSKEE